MRFLSLMSTLAVLALPVSIANAGKIPATLSVHMQDATFAHRVDALFGKAAPPDWLKTATGSEPVTVKIGGTSYTVLLACKQHDCGNHQLVVMFNADAMYGLRFETRDLSPSERLTWLNLGNGPGRGDRKTVLYAAITGSVFNHPEAFSAFP